MILLKELLPEDCVQKDSAEEIAMKLFRFVKPECVLLEEEPEDIMNDDDIERMTTMQIINSCVAGVGSIIINYYADIDSDLQSLENESRKKYIQGVAIKKHDRKWLISLEDDTDPFFVTTEDLMNDRKYYVVENNSEIRLNGAGARKQSLKKRRQRLREEMYSEQAAKKIADEKRLEWLKEECHAIKKPFLLIVKTTNSAISLPFARKFRSPSQQQLVIIVLLLADVTNLHALER